MTACMGKTEQVKAIVDQAKKAGLTIKQTDETVIIEIASIYQDSPPEIIYQALKKAPSDIWIVKYSPEFFVFAPPRAVTLLEERGGARLTHTAKPWNTYAFDQDRDYEIIIRSTTDDKCVAAVFIEDPKKPTKEELANLAIVMAAPDLNENAQYLDSIIPNIDGLADDEPVQITITATAARDIRALAKIIRSL